MLVFAEKEKCHSQVSLCPGPSSLSPDMQHSLGRSWQLQKTNLESQDSFSGVVFNSEQVFFSWVWPENACVKS